MRKLVTTTITSALALGLATMALAGCPGGGAEEERSVAGEASTDATRDVPTDGSASDPDSPGDGTSTTTSATNDGTSTTTSATNAATDTNTPPATDTDTTTPPASDADESAPPAGPRFVCPDGGMDEVTALQQAVDEGHQPWPMSAEDVAAACTYGVPDASVEAAGADRYRVTDTTTGEAAVVELAQPFGPGTIWVATSVSPA